jgi:hypothetical protein
VVNGVRQQGEKLAHSSITVQPGRIPIRHALKSRPDKAEVFGIDWSFLPADCLGMFVPPFCSRFSEIVQKKTPPSIRL